MQDIEHSKSLVSLTNPISMKKKLLSFQPIVAFIFFPIVRMADVFSSLYILNSFRYHHYKLKVMPRHMYLWHEAV